jgi:hypothetical protein
VDDLWKPLLILLQKAQDGKLHPGCQTAEVSGRNFTRATEKDVERGGRELRVPEQNWPARSPTHFEQDRNQASPGKMQASTHISVKDTRASYITNALDESERMSFIQK